MGWYSQVSRDISQIPSAIQYFETELVQAKQECKLHGNVEKQASMMPGIVEHRFNQLQEIEAILEFFFSKNILKIIKEHYQAEM